MSNKSRSSRIARVWQVAPLADTCSVISTDPEPFAMICPLASSGRVSTGYWRCTPGYFIWRYPVDETIVIMSGEAYINGVRRGPGDALCFHQGEEARWCIGTTLTKMYVIERRGRLRRLLHRLRDHG